MTSKTRRGPDYRPWVERWLARALLGPAHYVDQYDGMRAAFTRVGGLEVVFMGHAKAAAAHAEQLREAVAAGDAGNAAWFAKKLAEEEAELAELHLFDSATAIRGLDRKRARSLWELVRAARSQGKAGAASRWKLDEQAQLQRSVVASALDMVRSAKIQSLPLSRRVRAAAHGAAVKHKLLGTNADEKQRRKVLARVARWMRQEEPALRSPESHTRM